MNHSNRIRFVCSYDIISDNPQRRIALSAVNKLNYIISAMNRIGYGVDIVSSSCYCGEPLRYLPKSVEFVENDNQLFLFSSFGGRGLPFNLCRKWVLIQLFFFLLCHLKKNEIVLVYHSTALFRLMRWIKRIKKCKIIGEIEEIYQHVLRLSKSLCKAEMEFIYSCDKFIFPTQLLNEKVNIKGKPFIIIHGTYYLPAVYEEGVFQDNRIHVVYAGTLNPSKGAALAVAAAAFLNEDYHIHILGVGSHKEVETIKSIITNISDKTAALVTYDGVLKGAAFDRFLQSCHIGLSTQDPNAAFNSTSFPSKILTYMGNGLTVVSIRIPAIELSAVASQIQFYNDQSPREVARAIISASNNLSFEKNRREISKMDSCFINELPSFLTS